MRSLKCWGEAYDPRLGSLRDSTIKNHGGDYSNLDLKFRNKVWHGFKKRTALIEAGFDGCVYDSFYRPTSEMAHGEPHAYVMRNDNDEWIFGRSDLREARYRAGAFVSSSFFLMTALRQINRALGLSLGSRIEAFATTLYEFSPEYRELMFGTTRKSDPLTTEDAINSL